jgi:pimeloyl-ACP methyl ester carboxylesterase
METERRADAISSAVAMTAAMEVTMRNLTKILSFAAAVALSATAAAHAQSAGAKPTVVLVHGAFADSSGWNGVIARLNKRGITTIAAANPLRSVASDAANISAVVQSISGPVILVGHSYGGFVITDAANGNANVKALVYVAGFVPDAGESALTLAAKFPGSTLGNALRPVMLQDGNQDLYIQTDKFHAQFAADVPAAEAALMASTQRPVTYAALNEASRSPAWKNLPTYIIYGTADRNIPAAFVQFAAERAHARKTVRLEGASHALMISQPDKVAALIEEAVSAK